MAYYRKEDLEDVGSLLQGININWLLVFVIVINIIVLFMII